MNTNRVNEIVNNFNSFKKETYHKSEILSELFALQRELVEMTFGKETAETADLKIWDVERRLDEMSAEHGNISAEALETFKKDCKYICNLIKAEISGNRGEAKAFGILEHIRAEHIILKNIELCDCDMRSELDAVVITKCGAFIVEVKNTGKNIFIDEGGNYYRTGEFLRWDSNIGEKMNAKKSLLRSVLDDNGFASVQIFEVVVFTNNRIEVQNKYTELRTCFLSQLPYVIDGSRENILSIVDMECVAKVISDANNAKSYPLEFDVTAFKYRFANLIVELETAPQVVDDTPATDLATKKTNWIKAIASAFNRKSLRYAEAAALFAVSFVSIFKTN